MEEKLPYEKGEISNEKLNFDRRQNSKHIFKQIKLDKS